MVYNTQNYWVFGVCPSPGILKTRKRNVSETGSISMLRRGGKTPTQLAPLERANLFHLKAETDQVSEMLCFLVSRILDDGRSPKNPIILKNLIV
jgi:hypothetical protein